MRQIMKCFARPRVEGNIVKVMGNYLSCLRQLRLFDGRAGGRECVYAAMRTWRRMKLNGKSLSLLL